MIRRLDTEFRWKQRGAQRMISRTNAGGGSQHASANRLGPGNICPSANSFRANPLVRHDSGSAASPPAGVLGFATASRSHRSAPGIRGPARYSALGLRGEVGMCHETSRSLVVASGEVVSDGALQEGEGREGRGGREGAKAYLGEGDEFCRGDQQGYLGGGAGAGGGEGPCSCGCDGGQGGHGVRAGELRG